jgi:hypothetical protein
MVEIDGMSRSEKIAGVNVRVIATKYPTTKLLSVACVVNTHVMKSRDAIIQRWEMEEVNDLTLDLDSVRDKENQFLLAAAGVVSIVGKPSAYVV